MMDGVGHGRGGLSRKTLRGSEGCRHAQHEKLPPIISQLGSRHARLHAAARDTLHCTICDLGSSQAVLYTWPNMKSFRDHFHVFFSILYQPNKVYSVQRAKSVHQTWEPSETSNVCTVVPDARPKTDTASISGMVPDIKYISYSTVFLLFARQQIQKSVPPKKGVVS